MGEIRRNLRKIFMMDKYSGEEWSAVWCLGGCIRYEKLGESFVVDNEVNVGGVWRRLRSRKAWEMMYN